MKHRSDAICENELGLLICQSFSIGEKSLVSDEISLKRCKIPVVKIPRRGIYQSTQEENRVTMGKKSMNNGR